MNWNSKNGRPSEYEPPMEKPPVKAEPITEGGKEKPGLVQFVDLSRYQPNVNYGNLVKAGFQGIIAKATDGEGGIDAMFEKHAKAAKDHGLVFGAYCFNRFSSDPIRQAELFMKVAGDNTRLLVGDIEWDRSKTTEAKFGKRYGEGKTMDPAAADHALKFMEHIAARGFNQWLYSNTYFFLGFPNPERFSRFPYWASNYQQKTKKVMDLDLSKVPLPKPYKKCVAWQYSDRHPEARSITGDDGLDANIYFGTLDELRKLANP